MPSALAFLIVLSALLAVGARGLWRRLPTLHASLIRPAAIGVGAMLGVAAGLPIAIALNPFVGLQAGSFHNLMLLAMCLGFLGFVVGAQAGLLLGGMVLSPDSRTPQGGLDPMTDSGPESNVPAATATTGSPETPRGSDNRAAPVSFGAFLAQAERSHEAQQPGGDG